MYADELIQSLLKKTQLLLQENVDVSNLSDLRDVLVFHEWNYHIKFQPLISDHEYDQLYKKLEAIESAHPELITSESPTQRVSLGVTESQDTVKHLTPMLSLANSYNADDLQAFDDSIKKLTGEAAGKKIIYCVEPKYDGGSVAFVYESDKLLRASTRGNGIQGEVMTANARTLPSIPLSASFSKLGIKTVELRGEAVIRKDTFDKINKTREQNGQSIFANPRNAAAGGLRMKNPHETRERGIEVFLFQMSYALDEAGADAIPQYESHFERINLLGDLGFRVPTIEKKNCEGIEEVIAFINEWAKKRDDYQYEIDGMVVKVDSYDLQEQCGSTQHHPRWAIAYKFKAKQATTQLIGVEYQIGKIGSVTPVAKLQPVALAGVTIASVSLHNEEFITNKDLRIGDQVLVERAGDVIPYIVKSLPEYRDGSEQPVAFPTQCPSCSTVLIKNDKEAAWRCTNFQCEAQRLQRLIFHVSKPAMDIDGFGKSYAELFYQKGWLNDLSDVYSLDYDAIARLEGFGPKSAQNLQASIEKAKQNPIHRLLHSLSIHHLGKKASKLLAEQINHVMDLRYWRKEDFMNIKDIGPVVAENVIAFFQDEANLAMLNRLEARGVNMEQTEDDKPLVLKTDAPLSGKTILFTGSLQNMSRKEAQAMATEAGARNISAVSSNLNVLVVGEKAGSKLKKAEALGSVEIMTEQAFLELINE